MDIFSDSQVKPICEFHFFVNLICICTHLFTPFPWPTKTLAWAGELLRLWRVRSINLPFIAPPYIPMDDLGVVVGPRGAGGEANLKQLQHIYLDV